MKLRGPIKSRWNRRADHLVGWGQDLVAAENRRRQLPLFSRSARHPRHWRSERDRLGGGPLAAAREPGRTVHRPPNRSLHHARRRSRDADTPLIKGADTALCRKHRTRPTTAGIGACAAACSATGIYAGPDEPVGDVLGVVAGNIFYFRRADLNAGEDINVGADPTREVFPSSEISGMRTTIRRNRVRVSLFFAEA